MKRAHAGGKPIAEIERRMKEIDKTFQAGNIYSGVMKLDELIRDLEQTKH